MGLPTLDRKRLKKMFSQAFTHQLQPNPTFGPPTVAIVDYMQFLKSAPKDLSTKDEIIAYFVHKIGYMLLTRGSTLRTVIVLVDGKPIPVKRMVTHKDRYKNKNVLSAKKGPHLPKNGFDPVPLVTSGNWIQFAGNSKNLQRELYPELFNAFVSCKYFTPLVGQMILLSGFPGRTGFEEIRTPPTWDQRTNHHAQVEVVQLWKQGELPITKAMERADPDLYNRVYTIENVAPCPQYPNGGIRKAEIKEMKNDISEADIRMFYFDHWYQYGTHILFSLNDGDVFSIGALYALERCVSISPERKYEFRNQHTVMMPYKLLEKDEDGKVVPKKVGPDGKPPKPEYEYIDLNILSQSICEYEPFKTAQVQNPTLTLVFMLIMAGSDFFQEFLKGIGSQTVIWPVLLDNMEFFSHLVQMSNGLPTCTRTERTIVGDEVVFFLYGIQKGV